MTQEQRHVVWHLGHLEEYFQKETDQKSCCMALRTFRRIFPKGNRPERIPQSSSNINASGKEMKTEGKYKIPLNIGGKEHTIPITAFADLKSEMLLGLDFMHRTGLSYDARRREFFQSDRNSYWKNANMELSENVTLNPISNAVVTINVVTRDQARPKQRQHSHGHRQQPRTRDHRRTSSHQNQQDGTSSNGNFQL